MCCCGNPTINGEIGYRWNDPNHPPGVHPLNAPELQEHDILLHDEPGRCGGLDSHAYHYRLVRQFSSTYLLVRHGGGDERFRLSCTDSLLVGLAVMDSTLRYWTFNAIYHARAEARRTARDNEATLWKTAAAEKRIRTRKTRGANTVKVWIEPQKPTSTT
jgi:hypothetical protein